MATSYSSGYPPPQQQNPDLEAGSNSRYPYPPMNNGNSTYLSPNQAQYGKPITPPEGPESEQERQRMVARTPSPTPSEAKELKTGAIDWKTISNWRFWIRREWLWYYVILIVILVITALVTLYHKQIVHWLTPVTKWLHDLKFGWLVPIGVLFVISFPPLFGHEIVAILCGLVWGLWIGFAIVSAGTFLGEVGNFYAFKYCCRSRGEKLERTKITYACLAKVVRDGGFKIALIARLSAIPGHFTTAVFSTCGMGIIVFSLAAILSMPKQFITVYLGVILEQSDTGVKDTKSRIISDVVLALTFIITAVAMWYIYRQMNKVKPEVIYERRKARQGKLVRAWAASDSNSPAPYNNAFASETTIGFPGSSPGHSTDAIPLKSTNPHIYAPQPQAARPPGAGYANMYDSSSHGHGHRPQESTDEVGWDMMNMQPMEHARPDLYGGYYSGVKRQGSDSSEEGGGVETLRNTNYHNPHGAPIPIAGKSSSVEAQEHRETERRRHTDQYQEQQQVPMAQTPTQAQFVSWQAPSSTSDQQTPTQAQMQKSTNRLTGANGQLPMPSFAPTLAATTERSESGHREEPTDASFRTALSSSPEPVKDGVHTTYAGGPSQPPAAQPPPVQRQQTRPDQGHASRQGSNPSTARPPSYQTYAT